MDLFNGKFDDVDIRETQFRGSKGAVINPQNVYNKDLRETKLCDVTIKGSFNGVYVKEADFTSS